MYHWQALWLQSVGPSYPCLESAGIDDQVFRRWQQALSKPNWDGVGCLVEGAAWSNRVAYGIEMMLRVLGLMG